MPTPIDSNTTTTSIPKTDRPAQFSQPPEKPRTKHRWWVWLLVALALIGGYIIYRQHVATEQAAQAKAAAAQHSVPVTAGKASKGDVGVYVEALGAVTPVYTVTVTSRVQGQIMEVHYREGQMVRKGNPLLDIDPRPYQAALDEAEGQLAHDQALLAEAQIDLTRYQTALARNAIAEQQVADQQQIVYQDQGTVKNDQGLVANAQVNVVYTHITSPIDGRVGLRLVDPGNIVQANSTNSLVVITQLQPITVIFSVAEDYLPEILKQLRQGHKLEVDAYDRSQETKLASGSLLTLDNEVDPTTGTIKLRAIFANKDSSLFPNQFVNARLLVETQQNVTLVPTAAIQRTSQNAFVYVIGPDQTAKMRTVTVGTANGDVTAVQGVQPGEAIAVDGFDKLQDGVKVSVRSGKGKSNSSGGNSSGDQTP
ncbi:MAG: efflux RND transporter periplasmic adaptor subunit [Candidatus Acidiferrales bacterium]